MKRLLLIISAIFLLLLVNSAFAEEGSLTINWQVLDAKLRPGGETTVFLILTNPSKAIAIRNIELFISPGQYVIPSTRYMKIGNLEAGATQQTSLTIKIDSVATSMLSYMSVKATYYPDSTQKETTVNIPIKITRVPLLQIEDVRYDPALIEPGSTVQLSFNLRNRGDGSAKDVRIVLNQLENVFVTESEEKFISEISPNQKIQVSFNLTLNPSVAIGTYSIPISLLYLDETKTENYSSVKHVGLTISGKYNFIVVLESQDIIAPGTGGAATIKIVNAGTQEAEFLTLKVLPSDPLTQIMPSIAYIGNLKSDDYSTEKFTLRVDEKAKERDYPLALEISYRDAYGKSYTEQHSVNIRISSPEKLPRKKPPLLFIAIAGFLLILSTYLISKKFLKGKK